MQSFIDTHCHLYLNSKKEEEEVVKNFKKSGGKYMICIGVDIETSKKAIELSKKYDFIFATIGIHPSDSIKYIGSLEKNIKILEKLYNENKENIVGIGECGLDYFHTDKDDIETIENQKDFFRSQINLAHKLNLPVIIHNRESKHDVAEIIKETKLKNFILHCFSEDLEYANKLLEYSPKCKISFSGIVTFSSAKSVQETVQNIPLKNIIVETDSPFLTPVPYRGKEENESAYTLYVLKKIIELRSEEKKLIENTILENSMKIFKLEK